MSLGTLQLNKILASNNSLLFETNNGIFVADNEIYDIINPLNNIKNNKWNFNNLNKNIMVSNMYPLSSFKVQSYQYKTDPIERKNNISDFVDIFAPNELYNKSCQFFNYAYGLSDYTTKNITYNTYVFNDNVLQSPTLSSLEMPINTYIYPSHNILQNDSTSGELTFYPLYNLSGIYFNYVSEFPLDFSYYGFDNTLSISSYNYVFADTFNTKNQYDNNYSVSSYITSTSNNYNVSGYLTNARIYNNIGSCADVLYLVYKNNIHYNTFETDITSSGIYFGMTPTSSFSSTGNIVDLQISDNIILNSDVINNYDNVETIASINRIENSIGHKSNLYSINIQNANINSSSLPESTKQNIKLTINNLINNIVTDITPVNTQLFNIYWNGE